MKNKIILALLITSMAITSVACGLEQAYDNGPKSLFAGKDEKEEEPEEAPVEEDPDANAKIEVIEGYSHSDEYNAAYERGERMGATYMKTGDSEVTEFSDWKEAYTTLINDSNSDANPSTYQLIYVNDDDIPELVYSFNEGMMSVASFADGYVQIFSSRVSTIDYIEKQNCLHAYENVDSTYYDYVLALKDGYWVSIALGVKGPLDIWSEDSFDENGEPIISYWEMNGQELSTEADYAEYLEKVYKRAVTTEVNLTKSADEVLKEIDEFE